MKKIYLESMGCAKNQVDSELLLSYAAEKGYEKTDKVTEADLIVVNTCGFIESAKEESINAFFSLYNANKGAKFVFAGCLAQRYAKELELEEADAIFGNRDLSYFPALLDALDDKKEKQIVLTPEYSETEKSGCERTSFLSTPSSCYLKISEGCNHRCNYCAIPVIRGPLRSVPFDDVVSEAKSLISRGFFEINIVAQDLGAYGTDSGEEEFTNLIETLASLDGDFRLRMLYIHPDTFPEKLIDIVADNKKIIPYFDIPFQHSSVKVLRGMKRTGDSDKYLALISRIRERLPEAVIRTTLMLGFPGEDREAFDELLSFVEKARFDWMGSFLYSREEDTPAYNMRGEKEHKRAIKTAKGWQAELEALQSQITEERLQRFVGNVYTALVEEEIKGEDLAIGRIYSQAPDVDGLTVIMGSGMKAGDIVEVGIRSVRGVDLEAVLIRRVK